MRKTAAFALIAVMAVVVIYSLIQSIVPVFISEPVEVRIKKGMSFRDAADVLLERGLVRDKNIFIMLGRISGIHKNLKFGYYSFRGNISLLDILKAMKDGFIIQKKVTIVEGDSFIEIKDKLVSNEVMTAEDFDMLSRDKKFLISLQVEAPSLEGYLFPDTYNFPKGLEPEEVLRIMVMRLRQEFDGALKDRAGHMGLNEREVLTIASIIEKEAFLDKERLLVSAVYHNRLRKGMPLQADPTAIYGIKPQSEGVTKKDLRRKTPYNTYIIKGLPPGPIASAGRKSIKAALYPAGVPYIYFVSNNDGTHTFSTSAQNHIRAVEEFRNKRRDKANGN